jgi:citrate lyase subunit beta/citryl-CoA lyase
MILLRSMLFTPGNNERMMRKTGTLGADAVILDLEDAVPLAEKESARRLVKDAIRQVSAGGAQVFVRVNALPTGLIAEDLSWSVQPGIAGIVLPKAESGEQIASVEKVITELERERHMELGSVALVPLLETARGVLKAKEIATASKRNIAVCFGAVDFTRDMGISLSQEGQEILYAMSHVALVARAANVVAIDSPCVEFDDLDRLEWEVQRARQLGFRGKLLIHPRQIECVNRLFSPSEEELAYARKVKTAFESAQERGLGAVSLEGKMIDIANLRQAEEVLSWAQAIRSRDRASQARGKTTEV